MFLHCAACVSLAFLLSFSTKHLSLWTTLQGTTALPTGRGSQKEGGQPLPTPLQGLAALETACWSHWPYFGERGVDD